MSENQLFFLIYNHECVTLQNPFLFYKGKKHAFSFYELSLFFPNCSIITLARSTHFLYTKEEMGREEKTSLAYSFYD